MNTEEIAQTVKFPKNSMHRFLVFASVYTHTSMNYVT